MWWGGRGNDPVRLHSSHGIAKVCGRPYTVLLKRSLQLSTVFRWVTWSKWETLRDTRKNTIFIILSLEHPAWGISSSILIFEISSKFFKIFHQNSSKISSKFLKFFIKSSQNFHQNSFKISTIEVKWKIIFLQHKNAVFRRFSRYLFAPCFSIAVLIFCVLDSNRGMSKPSTFAFTRRKLCLFCG